MFQIGDNVMHPGVGVCCIGDIREENFSDQKQLYYVLKPLYENANSTIYVPVDSNKIVLRKLLSEDEVKELIHAVNLDQPLWIENDNKRNEKFHTILKSLDHLKIIQLIIEIHNKQIEKKNTGKKLRMADLKAMQEAEKLIHQEFAFALKLEVDEVASYVMKELGIENV